MKKRYRLVLEVEAEHPSTDETIADEEMQEYILFETGCEWGMHGNNETESHRITYYEIEET